MREIAFDEQHAILLDIAKAFDLVCKKNHIPYLMLGGTMLGAIRHKGFIPWDDDMDFGVPRFYFDKLIKILDRDLPKNYRCRTIYNSQNIVLPFYKIEDVTTKCENDQYYGDMSEALGINIDIFPLDCCDLEDKEVKKILWMIDKYARVYTRATGGNKLNNFLKFIFRSIIPFSKETIYSYIENKSRSLKSGDYLANLYGRWKDKEIIPTKWYGNFDVCYQFEDYNFPGFVDFDKYLSKMYKTYMELPPISKQTTHASKVFKLDIHEML